MKFRTKYQRRRVVSPHGGKSMTAQEFKDECSIDGIIKRYGIQGQPIPKPFGTSVDCSAYGDFAQVMQTVIDAKEAFLELPSEIRAKFGHSPEAFYNWLSDPAHTDEAVALGLMVRSEPVKDPIEVLEKIAENTAHAATPAQ